MSWEENVRKVVPYTPGEQPNKAHMIKLNTNECPYPPAPGVTEALAGLKPEDFRLYPDPNADSLVSVLAEYYGLEKENVFVGVGSDDVLALAFQTFFNSDRPIVFPQITYSFYDVWAELFRIPYERPALDDSFHIKKEDYFKDTVFVIIADHNVRVYGDQIVPIDMFQIPAVIVSSDIPHQIFTNLTSQSDVLATALDLIGIDLSYPILGNSIFKDNKKNINLMIFDEIYAYRKEDKVAILVPNMPIKTYLYKDKKLIEIENDLVLEKEALALIYVLDDMYKNKSYK